MSKKTGVEIQKDGKSVKNSKGKLYFLHTVELKKGRKILFFSGKDKDAIEIDTKKYEVVENSRTGLPLMKGKK